MFGEDNPPLEDIAPMTSPSMPTPSMQTLIRWRDAKSERPPEPGLYLTEVDFGNGELQIIPGSFGKEGWARVFGIITRFALPQDTQHGEFVSVEQLKALKRYGLMDEGLEVEASGAWVRLSDIEQLGKGG